MTKPSREQQVDHIVEILDEEGTGAVDEPTVRREVEAAYEDLSQHSRVTPFIPILALRRARARVGQIEAEQHPVMGFVEAGEHPRFARGDVAHTVDGPFEILEVEQLSDSVRYSGRWVDEPA